MGWKVDKVWDLGYNLQTKNIFFFFSISISWRIFEGWPKCEVWDLGCNEEFVTFFPGSVGQIEKFMNDDEMKLCLKFQFFILSKDLNKKWNVESGKNPPIQLLSARKFGSQFQKFPGTVNWGTQLCKDMKRNEMESQWIHRFGLFVWNFSTVACAKLKNSWMKNCACFFNFFFWILRWKVG